MKEERLSLRKEIKYIVPMAKAVLIRNCLDRLLARDAYCADGAYSVRSLYMESVNNTDFSEKIAGTSHRKKVRLRIYNNETSLCKLEIKEKQGEWQYKQSILVEESDAKEIMAGHYGVLKSYFQDAGTGLKAYKIMQQGHYRPVVLIEYERMAYRYPMYDTRITIDGNIRASESCLSLWDTGVSYSPVSYENAILEIKYSGKLMGFISAALAQFNLEQSAYSKYCAGRRAYFDFDY
ncbi:MAG: polyphosphate polymerase domain-containing protein [Lachnospiraceae bacterium]|nr:polyphosphate polymerase domain-containing protein [Lachnospiraceae bacterium]